MADEYAKQAAAFSASQDGKEAGEKAHQRKVAGLQKQHEVLTGKIEGAQGEHDTLYVVVFPPPPFSPQPLSLLRPTAPRVHSSCTLGSLLDATAGRMLTVCARFLRRDGMSAMCNGPRSLSSCRAASHAEHKAAYLKIRKYSKKIGAGMAELDALEGDDANKEVLQKLRKLVALNEV